LNPEEKQKRLEVRRQIKYNKEHKIIDGIVHKWCKSGVHWEVMDDEHFYNNKSNRIDGYQPNCKKCTAKKMQNWRKENPEDYKKYDKLRNKKLYPSRKKYLTELSKSRTISGKHKEWQKNNPDKLRIYRLYRAMHKTHDITEQELNDLYEFANWSCMYCGLSEWFSIEKYGQKLHKDHAYNNGSNGIENCVLACKGCNCEKHDKDWNEWYIEGNPKYDAEKYDKIKTWLDMFGEENNINE
jgi:hypothetical protein